MAKVRRYYDRLRDKQSIHVDMFISDCLLPSTTKSHVLRNSEAYKLYETYCDYTGTFKVSKVHFGRCMSKRFTIRILDGYRYFNCELHRNITGEGL